MTPQNVAESVANFLQEVHKDYKGTDPKIQDRDLIVVPGYMPERTNQTDIQLPHIAVRVADVEDDDDVTTVSLYIIHATYDSDPVSGYLEIVNLMTRSRQEMLKKRILSNGTRLLLPLKSEIQAEQPRPIWVGLIVAKYQLPFVKEELIY
jgi:hypothetical protein